MLGLKLMYINKRWSRENNLLTYQHILYGGDEGPVRLDSVTEHQVSEGAKRHKLEHEHPEELPQWCGGILHGTPKDADTFVELEQLEQLQGVHEGD